MTIRCSSDQQAFAVVEIDTEKADLVDVGSLGATPQRAAEVHVDETVIAELVMLELHSSVYSGNLGPSPKAVAGHDSGRRSLLGGRCMMNQAPDIRFGVGTLLERLQTRHRVCRHSDQVRIESSTDGELYLLRKSRQRHNIPRPVLDVRLFGLAARSDLRRSVSESFGGHSKAHIEHLPWYFFSRKAIE